jgi:endoglucanase
MLHANSPFRRELLGSMKGMETYLGAHAIPPAIVSPAGDVRNSAGSIGFSAAVVPFLRAVGANAAAEQQLRRMESEKNARTGLYGSQPRYYDQNLALFSTGWYEDRFHYDANGLLQVIWK